MNAMCSSMSLELGRLAIAIRCLAVGQDVHLRTILLLLAQEQSRIVVVIRRRAL